MTGKVPGSCCLSPWRIATVSYCREKDLVKPEEVFPEYRHCENLECKVKESEMSFLGNVKKRGKNLYECCAA